MCKASIVAEYVAQAEEGETYAIGRSSHGLGALHPTNQTIAMCVVCVPDQAKVELDGIPVELQAQHGIGPRAAAVFVDTGANRHDLLAFSNGAEVPLWEFADQGVTMKVVETVKGSKGARDVVAQKELVDA